MSAEVPTRRSRLPLSLKLGTPLAVAALVALRLIGFEPWSSFDDWTYDRVLLPLLSEPERSDDVIIVEIDDRTLSELGERWPLTRATWARFVSAIERHQPAAIAIDVVFDQADDTSAIELGEGLLERIQDTGLNAGPRGATLERYLESEIARLDADQRLAAAIARSGNVVLGAIFSTTSQERQPIALAPIGEAAGRTFGFTANGVVASHARLGIAARRSAAMNVIVDPDGTVRRYPYLTQSGTSVYPSLALAALTTRETTAEGVTALVDRAADLDGAAPHIRFRMNGSVPRFRTVSFSDVLLAAEDDDDLTVALKDKVVLVGASAVGVEDQLHTPYAYRAPGVQVHAAAVENLATDKHLLMFGLAGWLAILEAFLVVALLAMFCGRGLDLWRFAAATLGAFLIHCLLVVAAAEAGWLLTMTPPLVGMALLCLAELIYRMGDARQQRQDMKERERILQAELDALERFRLMVNNVGDAIVTVDRERHIMWMNPAAEVLFGRRLDRTAGQSIQLLVPQWSRVVPDTPVLEGRRSAAPASAMCTRSNGDEFAAEVSITPMRMGRQLFDNCVFRDVEARKRVERLKEEFVSVVNHELRTPITSILGSLRLITGGGIGEVPPEILKLTTIAHTNGERLLYLVNDLLDIGKLESGNMSYDQRPVRVMDLLTTAVEAHSGYGHEYEVNVSIVGDIGDVEVSVEDKRIVQVIGNLLSNAIKHSPAGGTVVLTPTLRDDNVRVSVTDTGPGIPEEFHEHLFEKFTMTAAGDGRKRPGTGLGLSIAKRIVEDHGGTIHFKSKVGHGATFWFELPALR